MPLGNDATGPHVRVRMRMSRYGCIIRNHSYFMYVIFFFTFCRILFYLHEPDILKHVCRFERHYPIRDMTTDIVASA